jgi:hypothetical protein
MSVALPSALSGDVILVITAAENTNGVSPIVTSVTGAGLTFVRRSRSHGNGSGGANGNLETWWAYATSAIGSTSFTVNYATGFDDCSTLVLSVTGCATGSPWDATAGLPMTATNSSQPTSFTVSTAANALLLFSNTTGTRFTSFPGTAPSGYTLSSSAGTSAGTNWSYNVLYTKTSTTAQSGVVVTAVDSLGGPSDSSYDALVSSAPSTGATGTVTLGPLQAVGAVSAFNRSSGTVTLGPLQAVGAVSAFNPSSGAVALGPLLAVGAVSIFRSRPQIMILG